MIPINPKWFRFFRILQWGLAVLLIYGIIDRCVKQWDQFGWPVGQDLTVYNVLWVGLAMVLMPFNWWLELQKWHILQVQRGVQRQRKLVKAILAGVALGSITPGRIGEFGGRLLFANPGQRFHTAHAAIVGQAAQWVAMAFIGGPSLGLLLATREIPYLTGYISFSWVIGLLPGLILGIGYFAAPGLLKLLPENLSGGRLVRGMLTSLSNTKQVELLWLLILSLTRFSVYLIQYASLLKGFGAKEAWAGLVPDCGAVFFLQALLPLDALTGLLFRSNLALSAWGVEQASPFSILWATFVLWLINLALPSLVGMAVILRNKKSVSSLD
jgi:hypothetical protein